MAATLRPDQVRARIAAALEGLVLTTGSLGTLNEAPCAAEDFPKAVPAARSHLAFTVSLPSQDAVPVQRQRQGRALRVVELASVQLLHRCRTTDTVSDIDDALAAESEVIVAVIGASGADGLQVTYSGASQRSKQSDPENTYLIRLDFPASYHIATT